MVADPNRPPFAIRAENAFELARAGKAGPVSWCVITSCDKGEESYEAPDAGGTGGGVFASALVESLGAPASHDPGGALIPFGVWNQLSARVQTWCLANGRQMTPRIQADMVSPIELGATGRPG